MKLRLIGTEAECARLTFLLRFGPPDLELVKVSPPYPNNDGRQVRVYLELRFPEGLAPADRTFYSLILPDGGGGLLVDAWGREVDA
jgi:hypothetical protein